LLSCGGGDSALTSLPGAARSGSRYDVGVGRLLTDESFRALRQSGDDVNERLLSSQLAACQCAPDS
jgi:hypothetical protein